MAKILDQYLLSLLSIYSNEVEYLRGRRPIPEEMDHDALAALLVICEHWKEIEKKEEVSSLLSRAMEVQRRTGELMPFGWLSADKLPLRIGKLLLEQGSALTEEDVSYGLLSHSHSSVRWYTMNIFWFARSHLRRELMLPHLFKNIADTLGYVDEAVGLARSLFESDDAFFDAASSFEPPENFRDQYEDRLKQVKERKLFHACLKIFLQLELDIRKRIEKTLFLGPVAPVVGVIAKNCPLAEMS